MSEAAKNLLQRINAIREEVGYIQKDKSVSAGQGGNYKAVTHDMVTAQTRQSLIKHGVVSWPNLIVSKMSPPYKADGKQWLYEATYDFTFANVDSPDDKLVIRVDAHACDNGDKAPGKALSYAKKYAVLKLLDIETGEDEESRVPDGFDVEPWVTLIHEAPDIAELEAAYKTAYRAAHDAKDKTALKEIVSAKDARKAALKNEKATS